MNDRLTKPIEIDKLTTTLNHWLKIEGIKITEIIKVLPEELPPFDLAEALRLTNHNAILLRHVLIRFHEKYASAETQLRQWIEVEFFSEAKSLVYSIKGVASTLVATELTAAAQAFEIVLQSEKLDEIRPSLDNLTTALSRALIAIATLL
jgi:two-component system sensor histidine kinase/response regulator